MTDTEDKSIVRDRNIAGYTVGLGGWYGMQDNILAFSRFLEYTITAHVRSGTHC